MLYKDPKDQKAAFTPLEPHQMVRAALVRGMRPEYTGREKYRDLVKLYSKVDVGKIDTLFSLMGKEQLKESEKKSLDVLILKVAYDSKNWNNLDYKRLKQQGVIVEYSGDLSGLVKKVSETEENRVVFYQTPQWGKADYVKHIHWRNKLVLNGPDVTIQFAKDKGFELPKNFLKYRKLTEEVYKLLEKHRFTYKEALKTAIKVLKTPEYANRNISSLVIKNRNGNELIQHQLDFIESAEMLRYILGRGKEIIEKAYNRRVQPEKNGYPERVFYVPKRIPKKEWYENKVEIHYLPDFKNTKKDILGWMNTVTICDCEHALNLRNFEVKRGRTSRIMQTLDAHAGAVVLELQRQGGLSPNKSPNNMSPLPTRTLVEFTDRLRYNVAIETQIGRTRKRERLTEWQVEILINQRIKEEKLKYEDMYGPKEPIKNFILRPMYA
ncbi:hypothetical protein KY347_06035 [Candidatus Woesearchaeota archaeon]|nr:hypothetical protein [Candidatus Woesearchaeota archaeon]